MFDITPERVLERGQVRITGDQMGIRLESAMRMSADIVATHGIDYLPIFERLERELMNQVKKQSAYARAISLSNNE